MKFALLGGDGRMLALAELLEADGHGAAAYALGGDLPLAKAPVALEAVLDAIPADVPVLAGKAGEAVHGLCRARGLRLRDYFLREDFTLANAELTAEGALALLLAGPDALRGSRVLVVGYGRIGRLLAGKLAALGAEVTVAARRSEHRLAARLAGCRSVDFTAPGAAGYDAVVNTVPAPVFDAAALAALAPTRYIELASAPYGCAPDLARAAGLDYVLAAGLPAKHAPRAAAAAIRDAIYGILEDEAT